MTATAKSLPPSKVVTHDRCASLAAMGFNPFRQQRTSAFDYLMVAAAVVVCAALVVWAIVG
jgi:hypothetical protein